MGKAFDYSLPLIGVGYFRVELYTVKMFFFIGNARNRSRIGGGHEFKTIRHFNYTVTVWNNDDSGTGGDVDSDTDSILWARAEATGPGGSSVTIEVSLLAEAEGTAYTGYTAQAGAGAGKSYSSDDLNAMTDFSTQL